MGKGTCGMVCVWKSENNLKKSVPSTILVLGMELRSLGVGAVPLPAEPSHQPHVLGNINCISTVPQGII